MKISATTLGEPGDDWLSMTMKLGYLVSTVIFFAQFLIALTGRSGRWWRNWSNTFSNSPKKQNAPTAPAWRSSAT